MMARRVLGTLSALLAATIACGVLAAPARAGKPPIPPGPYAVQAGDSVWTIAKRAGVTRQALIDANGLKAPQYMIRVGQVVNVPARGTPPPPAPGNPPPPATKAPPPPPAPPPASRGDAVVAAAKRYLGRPYRLGGSGPKDFDCSGLVWRAYSDIGVRIGRTTRDQVKAGWSVGKDLRAARPGDIVVASGGGPNNMHDGIFAGFDKSGRALWVNSPRTGDVVKVAFVGNRRLVDIRRVV